MSADELAFTSATELAAMVRRRDVSPVELVELYLDRIERIDPQLNSFSTVEPELARAAAKDAEANLAEAEGQPFLGVPIGIKDLHLTEGMRTTFGTKTFAEFIPPMDEENVARLRRAGFVFLGKTNAPEFGTVPYSESELLGPCRNPWNTDHTAGGSSGGAAAALAAGLIPVAHGSDGGGSIRIPSSNCGVFGLKPSRGRVSNAPLFGETAAGLSTTGPISRYVIDAAGMLDVMRGYALGDPYWLPDPQRPYTEEAAQDPPPLRIGLVTTSPLTEFSAATIAAAEVGAKLFEDLGHTVEPLTLPFDGDKFKADFEVLWCATTAALPLDPATLEPYNAQLHALGCQRSAADFLRARTSLEMQSRMIIGATAAYDVVLSPTLAQPPLRIGELAEVTSAREMFDRLTDYVGFTPVANVTGQPAMSLPLAFSDEGLPIGVMVTGRPGDEATLFRLAGQAERATDWPSRRPPIS